MTPFTPSEFRELEDRIALEDDVARLKDYFAQDARSSDFAGLFIDHEAGGALVVMTLSGSLVAGALADVRQPNRVVARQATYSLRELSETRDEIAAAVSAHESSVEAVEEFYVDIASNRLVVGFEPDSLRSGSLPPSSFTERWPSDMIDARITRERPELSSLGWDSSAPPIVGGNGWGRAAGDFNQSDNWCTAGFRVTVEGRTGPFMLSAGHCHFSNGDPIYHRNVKLGEQFSWTFGLKVDFALFDLLKGKMNRRVYYTVGSGADLKAAVLGTTTDYTNGLPRCYTGRAADMTRCGTIVNGAWSGNYADGSYHEDLVRTSAGCIPGDSGSPLFKWLSSTESALATGIVSAGTGWYGDCWSAKWSNIPAGWGVHIDPAI